MDNIDEIIKLQALYKWQAELEQEKRRKLTDYLDRAFRSGCPQRIKDDAILDLFSPEFASKMNYDPYKRLAFETLRRNGDIFKLLEGFIDVINSQQKSIERIISESLNHARLK
jgi:hypothetical protein